MSIPPIDKCAEGQIRSLTDLWQTGAQNIHDVVIVGSGYGGSVAAATFAGCTSGEDPTRPLDVLVLERGKQYLPGEFPGRFGDVAGHLRVGRQSTGHVGGIKEGLFDVRLGDDVVALVANGLGGGSLFNAGVLLEPSLGDFKDGAWKDLLKELSQEGFFARAKKSLGGLVDVGGARVDNTIDMHPHVRRYGLAKLEALRALAGSCGKPVRLEALSISMNGGPNDAEVQLSPCNLCGDCMTGCNVGAKDSLDVNLLEEARRARADIVLGATVLRVTRAAAEGSKDPHWVLQVRHTDDRLQAREKSFLSLHARKVVLAAGTLGSTEILLRSRSDQIVFSSRLGEGFSCNGDNIAAVHRMAREVNGCADEDHVIEGRQVGPTITASIPMTLPGGNFLIQEFAVPGAMKRLFDEIVTTAYALETLSHPDATVHGEEGPDFADPLAVDAAHMKNTLLVGLIGHDDARGVLLLPAPDAETSKIPDTGTVRIRWPDARRSALLDAAHGELEAAAGKLGTPTALVSNPMWRLLPPGLEQLVSQPRGPVLTVHPLGGCPIGATAETGVVDEYGCVFDAGPETGDPWQGSLVVLDGSIIPGSLGVNPSLTISAVCLRAAEHLREAWTKPEASDPMPDRETSAARARPRPRKPQDPSRSPGGPVVATEVEIIERLHGEVEMHLCTDGPVKYVVELTLAYVPVSLSSLMSSLKRSVKVNAENELSRLRIYDAATWTEMNLRMKGDVDRHRHAMLEAPLSGDLALLHRERSRPLSRQLRSALAWLLNRGLRDTWQHYEDRFRAQRDRKSMQVFKRDPVPAALGTGRFTQLFRLATRAGEVRRFDYTLKIGKPIIDTFPLVDDCERFFGGVIKGSKRITYGCHANPWRQLTELRLATMPGISAPEENCGPVLRLDTRFFAGEGVPLLRITRQRDQPSALVDLSSLALHLARVLISTHLWTFRKPDARLDSEPKRLPAMIAGLPEPEVTPLNVARMRGKSGAMAKILLTRYARPESTLPPLVMIHGYSVSGNTFTHASLHCSAAEYFWHMGRDVWVLDLRSSTGLPTATYPWSIEEIALVDIPAAILHVRQATRRRVDVFAHCIGCAMLSMAILTDAESVRNNSIALGVDTYLTNEQLGILTAFNGVRLQGDPHPCIRRIVLSQKGPMMRYTDGNIFRGFLMQTVRRWLLSSNYQFRPTGPETVLDELLDRLLSSMPYPDEEYRIENPLTPWKKTRWVSTRHRMDALYGRDFNAANMDANALDAIDDLFGPIHLDTVAQTIHFTRFNTITNQRGRAEFVTKQRLRERWGGIPTFAIHGVENGLVDVDTQRLLRLRFQQADVRFFGRRYEGMGHQDVLIGKSSVKVFKDIDRWLGKSGSDDPLSAAPPLSRKHGRLGIRVLNPPPMLDHPWLGPRIKLPESGEAGITLVAMSRPDQGRATLCLVPAAAIFDGMRLASCRVLALQPGAVAVGSSGSSDEWLVVRPPICDIYRQADVDADADEVRGWLAIIAYQADETNAAQEPHGTGPLRPNTIGWYTGKGVEIDGSIFETLRMEGLQENLIDLAASWIAEESLAELEHCFVRFDDMARAEELTRVVRLDRSICIAVGSCQYPAGLVDQLVAHASLETMGSRLDRIDLSLFIGDQIYADATAGLVDPERSDEMYDQPNEKAMRVKAMRRVLRRVPAQMLLDDHEIVDNWEPTINSRGLFARRKGFRAYWKYQRMVSEPIAVGDDGGPADLTFEFGGYPFHLVDTRLGRSPRGSTPEAVPDLLNAKQWTAFEEWLLKHRDAVKFVAMPSLLLPRRLKTILDNGATSDAWDGFPASMARLFNFIWIHKIQNTVFLSGDEHHSMYSEIWLQDKLKIVSVHSSALYAPFPFANGVATDLAQSEVFHLESMSLPLKVMVRTRLAPPGDGFSLLSVSYANPKRPRLLIEFAKGGNASGPVRRIYIGSRTPFS